MHRYEQVDLPSNKAVTLTLGTNGGRDRGDVTGPAKADQPFQTLIERTMQKK
jgi:hypothetical protein